MSVLEKTSLYEIERKWLIEPEGRPNVSQLAGRISTVLPEIARNANEVATNILRLNAKEGSTFTYRYLNNHDIVHINELVPIGSGTFKRIYKSLLFDHETYEPSLVAIVSDSSPEDLEREVRFEESLPRESHVLQPIQLLSNGLAVYPLFNSNLSIFCRNHHLSKTRALNISRQIAEGIEAVHRIGTHRDIKLENILIKYHQTADNTIEIEEVVLSDCGSACREDDPIEKKSEKAIAYPYRPPEYWTRSCLTDPTFIASVTNKKVDIWSFGIVLFLLFENILSVEFINDVRQKLILPDQSAPESASELDQPASETEVGHKLMAYQGLREPRGTLEYLIFRMLKRNPIERPSITEVRELLQNESQSFLMQSF